MPRTIANISFSTVLLIGLMALVGGCPAGDAGVEEPKNVIGAPGPESERRQALRFAKDFVERLDRNDPVAALLAPNLKADQPEQALEAMFVGFRRWTGSFTRRVAFAYGFSESLPDHPPGHYFTIYYRSHFEKGNVEEKLIVLTDGKTALLAGYNQAKRILYADPSMPPPIVNEKTLYPEGQGG